MLNKLFEIWWKPVNELVKIVSNVSSTFDYSLVIFKERGQEVTCGTFMLIVQFKIVTKMSFWVEGLLT